MNIRTACFALLLSLLSLIAHADDLDRYDFYIGGMNADGIDDLYIEKVLGTQLFRVQGISY